MKEFQYIKFLSSITTGKTPSIFKFFIYRESENCEAGSPRVVRQQLLEFLSPVALHHGTSFLAAMAVVWRERKPTTLQTNYAVSRRP